MEQELINELNKNIIEQYQQLLDDLSIKVKKIIIIKNEKKLDDETLNNLTTVIVNMKKTIDSLKKQIDNMKKKAEKGISLFQNNDKRYSSIFTDSKYNDDFNKSNDKLEQVNEDISKMKDRIDYFDSFGNNKIALKVKTNLEKRLENLNKKKGTIQNKQSKIVDKAVREKLSLYKKSSKMFGNIGDKIIINSEKITKLDDSIIQLNSNKDKMIQIKNELLNNKDIRDKLLGVKIGFNEKLTQSKILSLQNKKGLLEKKEKHLIRRRVNKFIISKMKYKVSLFSKAINESFKVGVNTFKQVYDDVSFEEINKGYSK